MQSVQSEYCTHRQATAFDATVNSGIYAACDSAQIEQGTDWSDENIEKHGARKLLRMTCDIDACHEAYGRLLEENLVPDCEVELGNEKLNLRHLIDDAHAHCTIHRRLG